VTATVVVVSGERWPVRRADSLCWPPAVLFVVAVAIVVVGVLPAALAGEGSDGG